MGCVEPLTTSGMELFTKVRVDQRFPTAETQRLTKYRVGTLFIIEVPAQNVYKINYVNSAYDIGNFYLFLERGCFPNSAWENALGV